MPDRLRPLPDSVPAGDIPPEALNLTPEQVAAPSHPRSAFPWPGGESSGLERLEHYLWKTDAVASYKETRNGLVGTDYSTKFSAW